MCQIYKRFSRETTEPLHLTYVYLRIVLYKKMRFVLKYSYLVKDML